VVVPLIHDSYRDIVITIDGKEKVIEFDDEEGMLLFCQKTFFIEQTIEL
jgi:hypothetical protein